MKFGRLAVVAGGITFGAIAGAAFQFSSVSAASLSASRPSVVASSAAAASTPTPSPSCPARKLELAFTNNVTDPSALALHLPWGRPGRGRLRCAQG